MFDWAKNESRTIFLVQIFEILFVESIKYSFFLIVHSLKKEKHLKDVKFLFDAWSPFEMSKF